MWKTLAVAIAALASAAAPQLIPASVPEPAALPVPSVAPAAGKTFAATCRGDQVLDIRPDPAWVGQSFAGDHCQAPPVPAPIDGSRATRDQVVAAMLAAKRYEAAADAFQNCIDNYVASRRMSGSRPLTQTEVIIENHRVLVSLRAKKRAADQVAFAVNAFNEYGSECPDH